MKHHVKKLVHLSHMSFSKNLIDKNDVEVGIATSGVLFCQKHLGEHTHKVGLMVAFLGMVFGLFAWTNSIEIPEELSLYSGSNSVLHFNYGGNDFDGLMLRSGAKVVATEPIIFGASTIHCDRQVQGLYYNTLKGDRARPLSNDAWSGLDLTGLTMTGGLYMTCEGKGYGEIYGRIKYTLDGVDSYIVAGTNYDFAKNMYTGGFSGSLKITNSGGYLFDNYGGIAKVTSTGMEKLGLDMTGPVLTGLLPSGNLTTSGSLVLFVTTDGTSGCKYSNTNGNYSLMTNSFVSVNGMNYTANYAPTSGNNTIYVACKDAVGNMSTGVINFTAGSIQSLARFEIVTNRPQLYSGQFGTFTVRALSNLGTTMTNYTGTIAMSVTGAFTGQYTFSSGYTFLLSDTGSKIFTSGLQIYGSGNYYLKVWDTSNTGVSGSVTIPILFVPSLTPGNFSFDDVESADINKYYKSTTYTVTGLSYGTSVLATADKGILWINGQPYGKTGLVKNGDVVRVELLSSSEYYTEVFSRVTIGKKSTVYSITTRTQTDYTEPFVLNNAQKFYITRIVSNLLYNYYTVGSTEWTSFVEKLKDSLNDKMVYYDDYSTNDLKKSWLADKNYKVMAYMKTRVDSIVSKIKNSYNDLNYTYKTSKGKSFRVVYDYKLKKFYSPDTTKVYFDTKVQLQAFLTTK